MIGFLGKYSEKVEKHTLENAPKNTKCTSRDIQRDILHILANNVRNAVREEIGDAKFYVLIDEARDESKKEQMDIVLRFVSRDGFIKERLFDIEHVTDTCASTLKKGLESVLSRHNLTLENVRGQGYDGASNMHSEWKGLQALLLNDCPYAYYIHCFAHRLQLALLAAAKEVIHIYDFFTQLTSVVNIVGASSKRHDQLKAAQINQIANKIAVGELLTGRGENQIGTLQRAGDTRWGSHFHSICSLMKNYDAACIVVEKIIEEGTTYAQRVDVFAISKVLHSFEFVFKLHVMHEIMGTTYDLCQALQQQSQEILNAMNLVSTIKTLLQRLRDDGWVVLLEKVKLFCSKFEIEIPDMDSRLFNVENICKLASKYYPGENTEQERIHLKFQLSHYELDVSKHQDFQGIPTLSHLCEKLAKTATTERAFSAMKRIKTIIRCKMDNEFLTDNLVVHIDKDIATSFSTDSIVAEFESMKKRRLNFS